MRSLLGEILNRAPVPYVGEGRLAMPFARSTGAEAQMRAYGTVSTLFAIVNGTSTGAAKADWRLYRKAASGRKEDRVEVASHAALDLWNKPNPFMPRQEFVEVEQQHVDLVGEGWWVIGRDQRSPLPLELWPVRPDRMEPVPSRKDYLAGYVYTGPDGEKVPLKVTDVIMLRMPNPLDPYRGLGPVQALLTDIDAERYSAEWNRNFFINSAEPGGIIKVSKRMDDTEFRDFQRRWNEQHRGVAAAHRVALLEEGEWIDRKYTNRDMQFVELRQVSQEIIRRAFRFPKPMLGDSDDVNRANADAADVMMARWLIKPRLDRFKAALNHDLLPLYLPAATPGRPAPVSDLEFDYEDPTPPDEEAENASRDSRVAAATALIEAGFDPTEVLEAFDLPALSYTPPPAPVAAPPPAVPPAPGPPAARARQAVHVHHHHHGRPQGAGQGDPDRLAQLQEDWEEALDDLIDAWRGISADQRAELADQIREAIDDGDLEALAQIAVSTEAAAGLLEDHMADLTQLAAERMSDEAGDQDVDVDPVPGDMAVLGPFAAAVASLLGSGISTSAAREALRVQTEQSTGDEVAEHVTDYLKGLSDATLRDLLGGALTNAQQAGRVETMRAAPEAAYYADETLDGNTCVNCRKVDGKWLGNSLDEVEAVYPNGGYRDCLGRERCRGMVVAVWRPETTDD